MAYLWLLPNLAEFAVAVAIYMAVISTMVWQAINLYLASPNTFGAQLSTAACLFMFSDFMIAVNKLAIPFELSSSVILASYWASITLIAYSAHSSTNFKLVSD